MGTIGVAADRAYATLCGSHPYLRPWHFQWLPTKDLYADLRRVLPGLEGRVLDVGCGDKPYERWFAKARGYVGVDVSPGARVDHVIERAVPWPFPDESFDVVLCTQVLEHVSDLAHVLHELDRVLRPGGTLVVTVPFAYNEHGVPHDYRRFTAWEVRRMFGERFEVLELKRQGGVGSTVGALCLNWVESAAARHRGLRLAKTLLLPAWIPVCALVNLAGALLDALDRTDAYYGNVLLQARKRTAIPASAGPPKLP